MKEPLIIGHRGFAARFPDNSLAGIEAALTLGVDGVEVDVRPDASGRWVCHHDLRRDGREISEWRPQALARAGVPVLAAVVAAVPPERWLFLEVKPLPRAVLAAGLAELVDLLATRAGRVRVLSSSLAVLAVIQHRLPGAPSSWVVGSLPPAPPPAGVELSPRHTLIERLLPLGVPLHPWTVNRSRRLHELARLEVASITSNRPDLALAVLRG